MTDTPLQAFLRAAREKGEGYLYAIPENEEYVHIGPTFSDEWDGFPGLRGRRFDDQGDPLPLERGEYYITVRSLMSHERTFDHSGGVKEIDICRYLSESSSRTEVHRLGSLHTAVVLARTLNTSAGIVPRRPSRVGELQAKARHVETMITEIREQAERQVEDLIDTQRELQSAILQNFVDKSHSDKVGR